MPLGKLLILSCGASKQQYATREEAEVQAESLRASYRRTHGRQARKVYVYSCPVCESYHVGHRRKQGKNSHK